MTVYLLYKPDTTLPLRLVYSDVSESTPKTFSSVSSAREYGEDNIGVDKFVVVKEVSFIETPAEAIDG